MPRWLNVVTNLHNSEFNNKAIIFSAELEQFRTKYSCFVVDYKFTHGKLARICHEWCGAGNAEPFSDVVMVIKNICVGLFQKCNSIPADMSGKHD